MRTTAAGRKSWGRAVITAGVLLAGVLVSGPANADPPADTTQAVTSDGYADTVADEGHELIPVGDDAFVVVPGDVRPLITPQPVNGGYSLLRYVTGYAHGSYTVYLAATPGAEQMRSRVAASLAQISAETGLWLHLAPGLYADRPARSGEIIIRVSSISPCGWLTTNGGAIGCGGPSANGRGRIVSGDVWLAPGIECESVGLSTVAHELGHAFGLDHYEPPVNGMLQLMYPSTSSDAPMFRAGDRAGLRVLAGRPSALTHDDGHDDGTAPAPVAGPHLAATTIAADRTPAALGAASDGTWFSPSDVGRVLDTRNNIGLSGMFAHRQTRTLALADSFPDQVSAVALNLTAVGATTEGYITAYPGGTTLPRTSSANYGPGSDAANFQIVAVGPNNTIDLYNFGGNVHLLVDVAGVFSATGTDGFVSRSPVRILDTRQSPVPGERGLPLGCHSAIGIDPDTIAAAGAPWDYSAAVVNVTAIETSANGYVSLLDHWYTGYVGREPSTSTVNVAANSIRANLAITRGSMWSVYNGPGVLADSVVDLAGWFVDASSNPSAGSYVPVTPDRVIDTRNSDPRGRFRVNETRAVEFDAPEQATAVVVNVTVTEQTGEGYLTLSPTGSPRPNASNVNYRPGPAIPNLAIVQLGTNASIDVFAERGTPHVIVDVVGYFVPPG